MTTITITLPRATVEQALEALHVVLKDDYRLPYEKIVAATDALRAALAEPVQEPIGYLWPTGRHPEFRFTQQQRDGVDGTPVYTAPPQQAEPVEPVARVVEHGATVRLEWVSADAAHNAKVGPLFSMLPQRKPLTVTKLLPRKLPEDNDD